MIKVSKLFCLIFLVAATAGVQAQPATESVAGSPINMAGDEAIRRQAKTIQLRRTLVEAQEARARGDLLGAHKLYEQCYGLVQEIGPGGIGPEASQTIAGLSEVLMALAREDQRQQHYKDAEELFTRMLVVDPKNQIAIDAKRDNERRLEAQRGTIPDQDHINKIHDFREQEIQAATHVQNGKLLFEAGKLDEAEVELKIAYAMDPSNVAAYQYLTAIQQKRLANSARDTDLASTTSLLQVEKAWTKERRDLEYVARPNLYARTNLVYTGKS